VLYIGDNLGALAYEELEESTWALKLQWRFRTDCTVGSWDGPTSTTSSCRLKVEIHGARMTKMLFWVLCCMVHTESTATMVAGCQTVGTKTGGARWKNSSLEVFIIFPHRFTLALVLRTCRTLGCLTFRTPKGASKTRNGIASTGRTLSGTTMLLHDGTTSPEDWRFVTKRTRQDQVVDHGASDSIAGTESKDILHCQKCLESLAQSFEGQVQKGLSVSGWITLSDWWLW